MIHETWHHIPEHYPGIELDVMQIMPNHLHGIIVVCEVGAAPRGRPNPHIEIGRRTQVGPSIASPPERNGLTIPGNGRAQGPLPYNTVGHDGTIQIVNHQTIY